MNKNINVILDLDGTLISESAIVTTHPRPRRHLELFLNYLFENFKSVSVWTMSSQDRFVVMYHTILKPMLRNNKFKLIITREHKINQHPNKPIRAIQNFFPKSNINHRNTIIIDNYSENCRHYNCNNSICVPTYYHNTLDNKDEETDVFLNLICYMNSKFFREQIDKIKNPIPNIR